MVNYVGAVSCIFSFFLMRWFGRRTLMIFFMIIIIVALFGVTIFAELLTTVPSALASGVTQVLFLCLFSASFQNSLGPVFWCYASETCTNKGLSLCVIMNWAGSLVINITLPFMFSAIGAWGFAIYGLVAVAGFFFFLIFMKETKGLSMDQCKQIYN